MDCIRYICCIKSRNRYESVDEYDNDFIEEPVEPVIVSGDTESKFSKSITSVYKKFSTWSLPKKKPHENLFTLSPEKMDEFEHYVDKVIL